MKNILQVRKEIEAEIERLEVSVYANTNALALTPISNNSDDIANELRLSILGINEQILGLKKALCYTYEEPGRSYDEIRPDTQAI